MYRVSSKASTIAGYDLEGVIHGLPYTGHADPLAVSFFPEKPHAADGLDFPDGGWRAWSVAIGSAFMTFATIGWVNSFGVFQTYYEENTLKNHSASDIAWIGSIQYGLIFTPALFTGRLLDLGYYNGPLAINSFFYIVALFLVAECKTYLQFMLCQGVATGIFAGLIFGSSPAIVSHWFLKKRSQAFAILAIGSSISGTIFPIAVEQLIGKVGFPWAIRICAFILALAVIIANILLRPRLPPSKAQGGFFNWSAFRNPAFACCVVAYNLIMMCLYVPLIYLQGSAQAAGLSPNFAFYLTAISNCASLIGRIASGVLADRYGPLNVLIPFTMMGGIMSLVWPYVTSRLTPLVIVTIVYGCATGAFVTLLPSAPARLGGMSDAGRRIGMSITSVVLSATGGPPLAGVILSKSGGFKDVGVFVFVAITLGCTFLSFTRRLALGQWKGKF